MKNRLLAMLLAAIMIVCSMSLVSFAEEGDTFEFTNTNPEYLTVGANSHTSLYPGTYTTRTEGGATGITFWFNVKNLSAPVYLYGAIMDFTAADGTSFGSGSTGGANLQNSGFKVDADGDYFLYVPLNDALAWNWKSENGLLASFKNFRIKACNADVFDSTGNKLDVPFDIALMGIIEGELDLSQDEAEWLDADGEVIGSGVATATTIANTTVPNNGGNKNSVWVFSKLTIPDDITVEAPEGKYLYSWADADGNITLPILADTLTPVFLDKKIYVSYSVEAEDMAMGSTGNVVTVKLDDPEGVITSGSVSLTYAPEILYTENGESGVVTIEFDEVAEDGTVGTVTFDVLDNVAGTVTSSITGTAKRDDTDAIVLAASADLKVVGQQGGAYLDGEAVTINKTEGDVAPNSQSLWEGQVYLNGADGVTFVFELDGIESEIIADNFNIILNGGIHAWNSSNWQSGANNGDMIGAEQKFTENGKFFMYVNSVPVGGHAFKTVNNFQIFTNGGSLKGGDRVNNNENATFRMMAIVAANLAPTVNFYDGDQLITSYTHKYTSISGSNWSASAKTMGKLLSPAEIFALAQAAVAEGEEPIVAPTKESDIAEVIYELDGWVDAEGNLVDGVYMSGDVYPSYKEIDNRTKYNVVFKNYDGEVLCEIVVPEGVVPVFPAELGTPKKPSTNTNSYMFKGWDKDLTATPTTPEADGATAAEAIVYTATYEEIERRYDVVYYDEDGETVLDEDLYLVYGSASTTEVVPTKDADVQYTYTFEKWVDFDGNDVDLTAVKADMKVKPSFKATLNKYTVTFVDEDKETELGKSTVDYGTAATAPEATKEADDFYTYAFDKWVDADGNEVSITEVKGDMTVYATYTATFVPPYPDIASHWGKDAIEFILVNGIMNGMDGGFKPDVNMSRAMVVTVLHRYIGTPEVELPDDYVEFVDNEDQGTWYYDAVVWAKANLVVNGKDGNKFDPNGNVTREEFVVILYRFADQVMGEDVNYGRSTITGFADKDGISAWARNAVKWAYAEEDDLPATIPGVQPYEKTRYINGKGMKDGKPLFAPKANATRAEVATMLMRYMTAVRIPAAE